MSFLGDLWDGLVDAIENVVDAIVDAVQMFIDAVQDGLQDLFGIDIPEDLEGTLVTKTGNVSLLPVIYGRRSVGGVWIYTDVTGASNEFIWLVFALADGDSPINSIPNIYLDDLLSTDAKWAGNLSIESTLGDHTTQPFTALEAASPTWNATHLLLGTAAVAIKLTWNQDVYSGIPKFLFEVEGSKVLDISVLPTETRVFSQNPAEILFDYMTNSIYGKGLSIVDGVDIDLQSFIDAKNYCNDLITSYFGGPSHVRMQSNIVLQSGRKIMDNIKIILKTCRGTLPYINGVFYLIIEKHYTPADYGLANYFDFNTDNIIGQWSFQSGDVNTRYNQIKVTYPNEDLGYKPDIVIVESSTFRAEDQRLLEKQITLSGTTNVYRALDTASVLMRRSRQQIKVAFTSTPEALKVRSGTVVTVTHPTPGWVLKQFRVSKIRLKSTGLCLVQLSEHDSTVYDLILPNEANTAVDTNLPNPTNVSNITNVIPTSDETVLKIHTDGTLIVRLYLTWDIPLDIFVNGYDVEYKLSSDSIWLPGGSPNSIGNNEIYILNVTQGINYDFRVRAHNSGGFNGAFNTTLNHTIIGKTSKPADVTGFVALQNGINVIFRWNLIQDKDRDGYIIRYGPKGNSNWQDATPLTEETKGTNVTSADVPPGDWTFYIKAIDTSKNESINADSSNILVSNGFTVIQSQLNAPNWSGTLTGFYLYHTGKLVPLSTSNNTADGFDTFDKFVPSPIASATYEGIEVDIAFDDTVRVWGQIESALGPGEVGISNPLFEIDHKLDVGSYDGFIGWSTGQAIFRYVKAKLTLTTSEGIAYINQLQLVVDKAPVLQEQTGIVVAASGSTITFAKRYHSPPFVNVFYEGNNALIPTFELVTSQDFKFNLFNTSAANVGGTGGAYQSLGV